MLFWSYFGELPLRGSSWRQAHIFNARHARGVVILPRNILSRHTEPVEKAKKQVMPAEAGIHNSFKNRLPPSRE